MENNNNKSGIDASFYLNKEVTLFIEDHGRIIPREGILRGYDDINYYLEFVRGPKKEPIGYKKLTVIRIEPGLLMDKNQNRGDSHH